jgi:hypothetical protein
VVSPWPIARITRKHWSNWKVGLVRKTRAWSISLACVGPTAFVAASVEVDGLGRWRVVSGLVRQISVLAGTVFQDTHLPMRTWFRAMWNMTSQKNGISALGLQRILGLGSYRTAWLMLRKLRQPEGENCCLVSTWPFLCSSDGCSAPTREAPLTRTLMIISTSPASAGENPPHAESCFIGLLSSPSKSSP